MFSPLEWNKKFLESPGYNDAEKKYGVTIKRNPNAKWKVIGVHHLTGAENGGNHNIFCDVLDRDGKRINGIRLRMTQGNQSPVFAVIDKPPNEAGTNFPVWGETPVEVLIPDVEGSEAVGGMRINHADEDNGNNLGHHSFYVVFKDMAGAIPDLPPTPDPVPPTTPTQVGSIQLRLKRDEVLEQISKAPTDSEGYVTLQFDLGL